MARCIVARSHPGLATDRIPGDKVPSNTWVTSMFGSTQQRYKPPAEWVDDGEKRRFDSPAVGGRARVFDSLWPRGLARDEGESVCVRKEQPPNYAPSTEREAAEPEMYVIIIPC